MINRVIISENRPEEYNVLWVKPQYIDNKWYYTYNVCMFDLNTYVAISEEELLKLNLYTDIPIEQIVTNINFLEDDQYIDERGYIITPLPEQEIEDDTNLTSDL